MLKRGGLKGLLEGSDSSEEAAPLVQEQQTAPEDIRPQQQESWQTLLAKALAAMPPDVLAKVVGCVPRDVLLDIIKSRENDPIVKLALVLLDVQKP